MADSTSGRFVWYELVTPNGAGAHAFYSSVLGWTTESLDEIPDYSMFASNKGPLGGSVESGADTPYWTPCIEVPDADETVAQARTLGGAVLREPAALPNGSKYASLADPQGAMFGIYSSSGESEPGPDSDPDYGEFSWRELATTDNEAAFAFYEQLFGWEKVDEVDMGPMGVYLIFGRDGRQWGGMFNKGEQGRPGPGYWLNYVRVRDLDATIKKVEAERGSLLAGPMEVPGGDWIAQFTDPYGALFAVHLPAADARAALKHGAEEKASREEVQGRARGIDSGETGTETEEPRATTSRRKSARKKAESKKTTARKASTKKAAGKKATAKKAAGKKATAKKAAGKKATAKKTAKKKPATKKAATKKAATKKAATKKAATKKAATKKAATKKAATKKAATKKAGKKKSPSKKAGKTKKASAKKASAKKAKTRKTPTKKIARKKVARKKVAKKQAATKKRSTAGRSKKSTKAGTRKTTKRR